jgi:Ca-activated chloride channel family protein
VLSVFGTTFAGLGPAATAVVAAVGTVALVALYLLRERERRVAVAFVGLWHPGGGRRRMERIGRRLRRWLSLLLQMVLLWLLLFALADPRPAAIAPGGRTWLLLIDRSASMTATARPGAADRMAAAREVAHRIVAALAPDDRAMVASFARDVTAESGFESDRGRLDAALATVAAGEQPADLDRGLSFATAVLRGRPRPIVVVIGDGAYVSSEHADGIQVEQVPVGVPGNNLALLAFSARRRPLDAGAVDATVVIQSFARTPTRAALEIRAADRPVERLAVTLGPGERVTRTVGPLAAAQAELEARLIPAGDDLLAFDDRAYAVVPERVRRRVLVVGAEDLDLYLDGALLSFGDALTVRRVSPGEAERLRAQWGSFDVVVFDGVTPVPAPDQGRYLYFDPKGPGSPWPDRGIAADPIPTDADRRHPLLAQISLADLNIREARRLQLAPDDQAVAAALGTPLLVARSRPGLRMAALSFDVRRSDLPLRPSFPLLLANAFEWLDARPSETRGPERTGATAHVAVASGAATVVGPGGKVMRVAAAAGMVDVPLPRSGFYRVQSGTPPVLAANLFDASESDTRPAPALLLGGRALFAWSPPRSTRHYPFTTLALLAALALSLAEWLSHHRRWTV